MAETEHLKDNDVSGCKKTKTRKSCCVPKCINNGEKPDHIHGGLVSYFQMPTELKAQKEWLIKIMRDKGKNFNPGVNTYVCSAHFKKEDINITLTGMRRLKVGVIPSVFEWTKEHKPRREIVKHTPVPVVHKEEPIEDVPMNEDVEVYKDVSVQTNVDRPLSSITFSAQQMRGNNKMTVFYTGMPSFKVFEEFFNFLDVGEVGENIIYWNHGNDDAGDRSKSGRPRQLPPIDEYLLTLMRLRLGLFVEDLAYRFGISCATVSRITITWVNLMFLKLGDLNIWPSKATVKQFSPNSFRQKYPNVRVIIDATEVKVDQPSSLVLQSELFSTYKSHCTLKGLVGIIPSGPIVFVSQLYTGSISDRDLVLRSGFLNLPFERGDAVMADKGFTIEDLLLPLGVELNIPPFLGADGQFTPVQVVETQQIAGERIHVERAINVAKNFHIFDGVIPLALSGNQMWAVCCQLTNMQNPILSGD